MSSYTIGEILVWLLLTAVLAFALGWMSRELLLRTRTSPSAEPVPSAEAAEHVVRAEAAPARKPEPDVEPEPVPEHETSAIEPGPHPGSALPLADGAAPSPDHVVKVSRGSKIYHAPTSPAYARTKAAIWFTSPTAAEAAGFRKPKNG